MSAPRNRLRFHAVTVAGLRPVAADGSAVAVTFAVPLELRPAFAFAPGQHVTVRARVGGQSVRRAYSLCSTPADLDERGTLTIGVRRVPGGVFSSHANSALRVGDRLELLPPVGAFRADFDPARRRHFAAVAGGSGITPVLSLVRTGLAVEPLSSCTVLYGDRGADSMMFAEDLAELKNAYVDRLQLVPAFSREDPPVGLAGGRLHAARLGAVIARTLPPAAVAEWFVCGPLGLVRAAREALAGLGVGADAVHAEFFHTGAAPAPPVAPPVALPAGDGRGRRVTVVLDGRTVTVPVGGGQSLLDAALEARPELPYSCRNGVCATCRARVVDGRARMAGNWSLSAEEQAAGYVLTCRAVPVTEHVTVDFDVV
ncbi:MAG TPA: 2Fe-2S iron-sulfur cluster-binding protein [Nonomuraea sp.]|nr:2Fe-2S iron-sulfur cluster-binding protein [Nonomuraea sp.]